MSLDPGSAQIGPQLSLYLSKENIADSSDKRAAIAALRDFQDYHVTVS